MANQGQDWVQRAQQSSAKPLGMAMEGPAGRLHCPAQTALPCPKQHLGKHAEDLLVDVVDAAGVHLVLELCPQGRVLLGGEEEGGGVAASGQSGPVSRRKTGETDDTGQSRAS